ncbi:hypothetical protein EHR06_00275 [Leptospira dzoumogneensis]|uniref:Uncharacterized protein n=1 Tax=Leptospira dzoumogneensis TaxID=2484904 RepID=A0A4Z1AV12_9LEPT|nr:hypothetical protein EHR06_00275 [Leptospira dzoumogneensis]
MGDKNHTKSFIRIFRKHGQRLLKIFPIIRDFASKQTTKQKILSKERTFPLSRRQLMCFL